MKRFAFLAILLAACDGESAVTFDLTAPESSEELLPDGEIDFEWTLTGGGTEVVIGAVPLGADSGPIIFDQEVPEGPTSFPWIGVDLEATALPPDVYSVELLAVDAGTATRTVTLHGMFFTEPAIGATATATGSYDLHLRTVSLRPMDLTLWLGDHAIATRQINGEFVPFDRVITFDGLDTDGVAVPAGLYQVTVDATDGADLSYTVAGGSLDWTP